MVGSMIPALTRSSYSSVDVQAEVVWLSLVDDDELEAGVVGGLPELLERGQRCVEERAKNENISPPPRGGGSR